VVYGGGGAGLMGQVADGALSVGGEVIGVIPEKLMTLELGHRGCTRLEVVDGMHTRKRRMAELGDAFLALPGGWGTWEELFEAVTWTQLGYHAKPCGVLDAHGYYEPMAAMVARAIDDGFVRPLLRDLLLFDTDLDRLLDRMAAAELPALERWIDQP
ncbi:MAG TPA: TIGR00730 family Rossman fold protein, partial [Myxococcota bacterium]|nr:TIGR00730 family Rossman fold protein [Myxococcota bacterium]